MAADSNETVQLQACITGENCEGNEIVPRLLARIAELEGAAETLQKRLSGYERVYSENPVPTLVYDCKTFEIIEANESALELYGYTAEQIRPLRILDLFAPQPRSQAMALECE